MFGRFVGSQFIQAAERYLVIYDQLNPAFAKHYKEYEVRKLLEDAGFEDVKLHHRHGYSWSAVASKTTKARA